MNPPEKVIVLHGLNRTSRPMKQLSKKVGDAGFEAILIDYPSSEERIENLVDRIYNQLPSDEKLHFVGHSLGGILSKKLAKKLSSKNRGRIVQLGAPNFGSEIAERAAVFGKLIGPALKQLTPNSGEDDEGLDIGAIAGTAAVPAYGLITGIDGPNDGKVSVISAWGNAPPDKRISLPVAHVIMMQDKRVIDAVIKFLKEGTFT